MILKPDKQYTFSEIFELDGSIDELLHELGYKYLTARLDLVPYPISPEVAQQLQAKFYRRLPKISMNSDRAHREFVVSTILSELLDHVEFQLKTEYSVSNEHLSGKLDYLLRGDRQCVVSFARNDEMERGVRQLAVELITTADQLEIDQLYGVVTTGRFWEFVLLDQCTSTITRDLDGFIAPTKLAELMNTLAGQINS